ncbi:pyruvate kinase alpha/beta domain-containing protein [Desulfoluna sp.]|uniref:pyruvate kinase alpha/beta domain-containing protein n=1 Tax=Desulfoluna sp. TaxID=2045199 RepID=UPI0026378CAD|nr:pyruvate kinase alpha/beta domain-containing protein [Desulfoluna sp.]
MILFEKSGKINTDDVLKCVKEKGEALGIKTCVLATTRGFTAERAADILEGFSVVAVTHFTGLKGPNVQEMSADKRTELENSGVTVLTSGHTFFGIGRAVRMRFNTYQVDEVIAETLKLFGVGVKVAVEVSLMAADAGLIQTGEDVLCVGGTGAGADTAVLLRAVNTADFFTLKIQEILCKPVASV